MSPETRVAAFAVIAMSLFGLWRLGRWLFSGESKSDPWDEKTEEAINQPDAVPLCRRCLEPHDENARYCAHGGLPVDALVPLSPFHQVFAIGDVLLTGTQRKFPINWMTITGYVLLSMAQYLIFTPFYWFFLLRNVRRIRLESKLPDEAIASPANGESAGRLRAVGRWRMSFKKAFGCLLNDRASISFCRQLCVRSSIG